MSSGTCNTAIDGGKCPRPSGHPGDHMTETFTLPPEQPPAELCGAKQSAHSLDSCKSEKGHKGRHSDPAQGVSWPQDKVPEQPPADPSIPASVRARVRLHAAQTEYDLTVLRNRLDCLSTLTAQGKELRRKREQLTAELEAWTYLSKITHTRMD